MNQSNKNERIIIIHSLTYDICRKKMCNVIIRYDYM